MKKQSFILAILLLSSMIILNSSTFTVAANPSDVLITEVLYDTPGTDSIEEWIELYNPTSSAIDLTGWTISDNAGTYTLSGSIAANGYFVLALDTTGFFALYGFNPDLDIATLALSNTGDLISLKDATATEIDFVSWESYVAGWTISTTWETIRRISADDTDSVVDWEVSGDIGEPGTGTYTGSSSGGLLITEVLYDTPGTDSIEEWIELFNPTGSTIDLTGWTISDNVGTYTLSGSVESNGYFVLALDTTGFFALYGFNPDLDIATLALSNTGDLVSLKDDSGTEIDFVAWESYVAGWTISATWETIRRVSVDDTDSVVDWEVSGDLGEPGSGSYDGTGSGSLLITELLYDTPGTDSVEEWIELYNPTTSLIDLTGWTISDNAGTYTLSGSIAAEDYLIIAADSTGFNTLYGFTPDLVSGGALALSNTGDLLTLKDATATEIDFVAWESYVAGWTIFATFHTIYRVNLADSDTVSDWAVSTDLGTPSSGYGTPIPDTDPPIVTISNPTNGAILEGPVTVSFSATDASPLVSQEIFIDGILRTSTSSLYWDTTQETDASHTILARAEDNAGNIGEDTITVTVDNSNYVPPSVDAIKIMTYNVEESGAVAEWKDVVKEENPDIVVFVETGTWDDNGDLLLNQYISEFNAYFTSELPYVGVTTQGIAYSTSGEAVFSRFPIISTTQIPLVTLDDETIFDVSHDFIDVTIDVNGMYIHIIGSHLKCCSGVDNEVKRENAQEGIINYMDGLGDVPIMYMGDLNSFSPEDTGDLAPLGDLNYGPMSMMLMDDTFGSYSQYGSTVHTFTDVFRFLNPTTVGYTYGHQNPIYNSRIDFLNVNQYFDGKLVSSTVGDTASADVGSDHYSVDLIVDLGTTPDDTTPPVQVTGLAANVVSDSQIDISWDANSESDLDHYNIYRDTVFLTSITGTSFSDTGLTAETMYAYTVSAVDTSNNEGVQSSSASATTLATPDTTPPAQVTGLVVNTVSDSQIDISWDANVETDLDDYNIYRDGEFLTSVTSTSFSDTGLTAETLYSYTVSAVDISSNEGVQSSSASATTQASTPTTVDMMVDSIVLKYDKRADVMTVTIVILDANGDPVANALVSIDWTKPGGEVVPLQVTTGSDGKAVLLVNGIPIGTSYFTVTDITADGYAYNPSLNNETTESYYRRR